MKTIMLVGLAGLALAIQHPVETLVQEASNDSTDFAQDSAKDVETEVLAEKPRSKQHRRNAQDMTCASYCKLASSSMMEARTHKSAAMTMTAAITKYQALIASKGWGAAGYDKKSQRMYENAIVYYQD